MALKNVNEYVKKLNMDKWIIIKDENRKISLEIDNKNIAEDSKLDGCYVIKTDLTAEQAPKEIVHNRYKDLALVEQAFRTSKTTELDLRPIFVRKEESTRAHVFVVVLAYHLARFLKSCWKSVDATVQENINKLNQLCVMDVFVKDNYAFTSVPNPRKDLQELLTICNVTIPKAVCLEKSNVSTKIKLNNGLIY